MATELGRNKLLMIEINNTSFNLGLKDGLSFNMKHLEKETVILNREKKFYI